MTRDDEVYFGSLFALVVQILASLVNFELEILHHSFDLGRRPVLQKWHSHQEVTLQLHVSSDLFFVELLILVSIQGDELAVSQTYSLCDIETLICHHHRMSLSTKTLTSCQHFQLHVPLIFEQIFKLRQIGHLTRLEVKNHHQLGQFVKVFVLFKLLWVDNFELLILLVERGSHPFL